MAKIRKIREIKSKIKEVSGSKDEKISNLEEKAEQGELFDFIEFVQGGASQQEITPVLTDSSSIRILPEQPRTSDSQPTNTQPEQPIQQRTYSSQRNAYEAATLPSGSTDDTTRNVYNPSIRPEMRFVATENIMKPTQLQDNRILSQQPVEERSQIGAEDSQDNKKRRDEYYV